MLAKVSAPTISRFEQNAKDIQLSSVLQILDALGMTDRRSLTFSEGDFASDIVSGVTFWGQDGETRIRCRITREALDDHFSEGGKLRPEAAFEKHRKDIEALLRRNYLLDRLEQAGTIPTVLIRTQDII